MFSLLSFYFSMTCGHCIIPLYTVQTNRKLDKIHEKANYCLVPCYHPIHPITLFSENMLKWYGGHDVDRVYFERVAIIVEMEIETMVTATLYCDVCGSVNRPQAQFCISCGQSLQELALLRQHSGNAAVDQGTLTGHLLPSHLLKQRYRILMQVGQGGMGAVYKAEDTQFGNRLVAVKEMHQNGLRPEEIVEATESFKREAMLLAGLLHPNLPRTYDHFFDRGRWYLVMDFIEGETLEEYLNKIPATGASRRYAPQGSTRMLPVEEVLDIGVQLCTILHYLHTSQPPIIFRDLKPANIMLTVRRASLSV